MVWSNRTLQEHTTGVNQLQMKCQGVFHQHLNNLQGALNDNIRREGLLPDACQVSGTLLQGFKLAVHNKSIINRALVFPILTNVFLYVRMKEANFFIFCYYTFFLC